MKQLEAEQLQPERVHLGGYVDRELRDRLLELAHARDRSVSAELRLAVTEHLKRESASA